MKQAIDLLVKVAEGFLALNKAAVDLAAGRPPSVDLTDGGEVAHIEREARAVKSADPTFPECIPHPYRQLPIMRGVLVDLGKKLQESDCPEIWRGLAGSYVEQTALLRDVIGMRLFGLADLAAAKVRIAELNVKLASSAEARDKAEKALAKANNDLAEARDIKSKVDFLYSNEKKKIQRRSRTAKANPRRGFDDQMTDSQWDKFLRGLAKKIEADKARPLKQRKGQQTIIEEAVRVHNDASESQITIGWQGVKKRLQRWPKRPRQAH